MSQDSTIEVSDSSFSDPDEAGDRSGISIDIHDYNEAAEAIKAVRHTVFTLEQGVSVDEDIDGLDDRCVQILACAGSTAVGTARMLPDAHIGRIAVLAPWRGRGIGARMVRLLLRVARDKGHSSCYLHAQTHAIGFYEGLGFEAVGDEFLDAGIAHRGMIYRFRASDR
ncbi:GNAT family N-acetyltransferase [Thioalkalivibrio sp. HK1]|uniref:GNAT family N-acetyltransferase n=1 Tax=Thioalkalivibrio sp. HK1 TaxID=1469245 RepID=UPI000470AA88|nr:GNAT family N-acetyltransferase [Thioalkalivibrio sp. HK1]